ncbi:MAG: [FeFe] hydrogenase H-cluster radical SAM maturase HydG [Alphaproteobacteria bacterium]|nr:[FeFe] hydrogenase H-cluster radical SAM maturase HydG [Alphaproteobacteria bacterium]
MGTYDDVDNLPNFIDEGKIWAEIERAKNPAPELVRDVIKKANEEKGLNLFDVAVLLENKDKELDEEMLSVAKKIKLHIYGKRMVLFAPLYISNECCNKCAYCGFAHDNNDLKRKTLNDEEITKEVHAIEDMGHKRVLLVYGEHPVNNVNKMVSDVATVYAAKSGKSGEIRRVNINCAPLSTEDFKTLKSSDIGTYQCFQETYCRKRYEEVHLKGKKTNFLWRLYALHRAQEAGLDDVATGALFGLYDHRFEMLALLAHTQELEDKFGVGPHTISFPRIEPALGAEMSYNPPYPIDDYTFKKMVAILRLAVPYTGLILTTRENAELRRELLEVGVSQLSAASRTYPGAYSDPEFDRPDVQQFCVGDNRSLDEVIYDMLKNLEYIPSFCTGCYRLGRTGDHFMGLAKTAFINNCCQPNALITFSEYLQDYASEKTKKAGLALIQKEQGNLSEEKREKVKDALCRTNNGERDIFF